MKRASAADLVRNFSERSDEALKEPVIVTRNGRDRLVLTNVDHFRQIVSLVINAAAETAETKKLSAMLKAFG